MTDARGPRPLPPLPAEAHKGRAGRVLCLAGSRAMPGAAVLVARSAQRAGAGLVAAVCLDPSLLTILPVAAPEAVLVEAYDELLLGAEAEPGGLDALVDGRAAHARLAGPGLGDDERARYLVRGLLASPGAAPLVLDADGLNALDGEPERLRTARGPVVITPHPGEAQKLLGRPIPRDAEGRGAAARELAERSGAVVCLKGAQTVVTDGTRAVRNGTGNAGMASAGSGDVLAGILVAYLARAVASDVLDPFEQAYLAVHVHGLAGDLAAAELGPSGLVASDLITWLPAAQRRIEAG